MRTLVVVFAAALGSVSLVDELENARVEIDGSSYPTFSTEPGLSAPVALSRVSRDSLTPPFPARLRFDVEVPFSGYLETWIALVMHRRVSRARVEYAVEVSDDVTDGVTVFSEVLEIRQANVWHPRTIDLTRWSGSTVKLELVTRASRNDSNVLWADRIQTVWGSPTLVSRPWTRVLELGRDLEEPLEQSLEGIGASFGWAPHEIDRWREFAWSLLLGGLLSLWIRRLYRYFSGSPKEVLVHMLPAFTVTTILVIYVVQASLALALGLIGALTIIRFRTAIQSAEDLVYVLFAVTVGLCLGASRPGLSVITVATVSLFLWVWARLDRPQKLHQWRLMVSGDPALFFHDRNGALAALRRLPGRPTIERLDHDSEEASLTALVELEEPNNDALARLRERLRDLDVSLVDLDRPA